MYDHFLPHFEYTEDLENMFFLLQIVHVLEKNGWVVLVAWPVVATGTDWANVLAAATPPFALAWAVGVAFRAIHCFQSKAKTFCDDWDWEIGNESAMDVAAVAVAAEFRVDVVEADPKRTAAAAVLPRLRLDVAAVAVTVVASYHARILYWKEKLVWEKMADVEATTVARRLPKETNGGECHFSKDSDWKILACPLHQYHHHHAVVVVPQQKQ